MKNGYTLVELIICMGMIVVSIIIGLTLYATFHFVVKFW